jgi:hypothetical protein
MAGESAWTRENDKLECIRGDAAEPDVAHDKALDDGDRDRSPGVDLDVAASSTGVPADKTSVWQLIVEPVWLQSTPVDVNLRMPVLGENSMERL